MPTLAAAISLEQFTTFGDLLKYLRRRAGLTQRELSIAVGYSNTQISRLELNQRPPDQATIAALFVPALGIDHEPETATRLLTLAAAMQRADAPASGLPPFKGLQCFEEADADLFFGRETLVANLLERLQTGLPGQRFLGIVGASGSGKSSLVRAGLVPAVRWGHGSTQWRIYTLTPTAHPLHALATSLSETAGPSAAAARRGALEVAQLTEALVTDSRALHALAQRRLEQTSTAATPERVLIVVDQFEELFTLCRNAADRQAFVDNLMTAALESNGPVCVALTLRADFYSNCAPYTELRDALAARQAYIGPMSGDELRRAIEEPARHGGWELEPGLVEVLLKDLGADGAHAPEPGALPLLSHALMETWQRRRGRTLTVSGYLASGGVRGAIAETAEAVFHDELDANQRAIARTIFLRLTEIGESDVVAETRRRATFEELIRQPDDAPAVREVLTRLADARLITTDEGVAEVAHEALIREWPTLRAWLEENRDELRLHRHLTLAAEGWVRQRRDPGELYRGARLAQAQEWAQSHPAELNVLEREFLGAAVAQASQETEEREAQRERELDAARQLALAEQRRAEHQTRTSGQLRRRALYLGAALALVVMAALTAAFFANRNAANFTRSEAQRLAAEAISLSRQVADPQLIGLLSLRSIATEYTVEGDTALTGAAGLPLPQRIFAGHEDGVYSVAFSPDGKRLLTGGYDGTARLWDLETGQPLHIFTGHRGLRGIFDPSGQTLYISDWEGLVRSYDAATGALLNSFSASDDFLTDLRISRDGRYLFTGGGADFEASGRESLARLWDLETGQMLHEFYDHEAQLREIDISPDGKTLLTTSVDATARLYAAESGEPLHTLSGHTDEVTSGVFSPDGRYVVTGSRDETVRLWEVATGQEVRQFTGHGYWVNDVAFSPDGRYLLTGSADKSAKLWEVETGRELYQFSGHSEGIVSVAFTPDGRYIVTASHDFTAWLWDLHQAGGQHPRFAGHGEAVYGVAFAPDGRSVASSGADSLALLWDAQTGQGVQSFLGHDYWINSLTFSPDGRYLLTGGMDESARLWDVGTGQWVRTFAHEPGGVSTVAYSADGRYVLTAGWDGSARRWDAQTGERLNVYGNIEEECCTTAESVYGVVFSPDGRYVLTGSYDQVMRLWDAESGTMLREFLGHTDSLNGVSFSPDGRRALSASFDKTARLWDVETGEELLQLVGHTAYLYNAVFSPDGRLALTAGADHTVRLWDLETGAELRRFTGHAGPVEWVQFSPDGTLFASASDDGTARIWSVDYQTTVSYLCDHLLRDFTDEERQRYHINDTRPTCSE